MPSVKQTTVDPAATDGGLGSSNTETLVSSFPASPIHNGDLTRDSVQEEYEASAMTGVVKDGNGLPSYNRDFTGGSTSSLEGFQVPPDGTVADAGAGGGAPASAYVPNPASPGPGSQNPSDLPAAPDGFGQSPNGDTYGVGTGALTKPADTSKAISSVKLGSYGLGTSNSGT